MIYAMVHQPASNNAQSPFRVIVQKTGRQVDWIARYLDQSCVRGLARHTLRSYALDLLHFVRWWADIHKTDAVTQEALTGSTLLDYVRFQAGREPRPAADTINRRVWVVERALRNLFPDAAAPIAPGFQHFYWRRSALGYGRPRPALSRLRVKVPQRVVIPLSIDEVARFWSSFQTSRDLAIVGLMLLQGLRSCEVLALNPDDLILAEAQIRVLGKGNKVRLLPLAPETIELLNHYLRLERPVNCGSALFVSLKGRARGIRMTPEGLRALFRYHRQTTGVTKANTAHYFLRYLGTHHPDVRSLQHLRRDPHILGWLADLWPRLAKSTRSLHAISLRRLLEELAWTQDLPVLLRLLYPDDIPRPDARLPRPLTPEQDRLIQEELLRRNDLASNVLLLLRHTGMRIGECVDLSFDCLRPLGPQQWAIHVPLGKLKTERMVPVDPFVCQLVHRLRFFRSLDPIEPDGRLLARRNNRPVLLVELRAALVNVRIAAGITAPIVPHQFRHTFATEMLRSGVSLPALMKLLGHSTPKMTLLYAEITQTDLQREFHLARANPRHLVPPPKLSVPPSGPQADLPGVLHSLQAFQHVVEMFRRNLPEGEDRRFLGHLMNRLTKILARVRKFDPGQK